MPKGQSTGPEFAANELICLQNLLKNETLSGNHLEIGTGSGGTLIEMIKCYNGRKKPHFVVVDPMSYFPNQHELVNDNLKNNGIDPSTLDFRKMKSFDAFNYADKQNERFDFILIDGVHKMRYVAQDLRWARLLNTGGILCFHDYRLKTKGVMKAADRFLYKHDNYSKVTLVDSLLVLRKNSASSVVETSNMDLLIANIMSFAIQMENSIKKRLSRLT